MMDHDAPTKNINLVPGGAGEVIKLGPVTMIILEDGSRTDNRLGAASIHLPPHTPGPEQHWHQMHDETFLITSGTVRFTSRDLEKDANAGDYVVAPPLAPHTFANASDQEATMVCTFTPSFYVNYFRYMRDEAEKNGGVLTKEIGFEAMRRYATIQTGKQQ